MSVETHLHRARDRVESEGETLSRKNDALGEFADRVAEIETAGQRAKQVSGTVTAPVSTGGGGGGIDRREAVRSAFAETVLAHAESDSALSAIRAELGDDAALALAQTTDVSFTPALQTQLLSAVTARRREIRVTRDALERETESLSTIVETVDDTTSWLGEADETPLSELDFEELRARHERLEAFRETATEQVADRQELLATTTSTAGQVGVSHRPLVRSLYEDFPVTYPALSTLVGLAETCEDAQQTVRAHLVRRA